MGAASRGSGLQPAARPRRRRAGHLAAACAIVLLLSPSASAQTPEPTMQDILSFLITNQSVPTGDFERDRQAAESTRDTMARALLATLATAPLVTSSGGFVYQLNPVLGTAERVTDSFGPFFVDRAAALGSGRVSFGVTWQWARFTTLDGRSLRDGTFVTTANRLLEEAEPFDTETLNLELDTHTVTIALMAGVTDGLDVGVALPLVRIEMQGQRTNTYRGEQFLQAEADAYSSGLGDLAVRAKYTLFSRGGAGVALGAELRLPTGREEDLLGTGSTAYRGYLVASRERGPVASHVTFGASGGGLSEELRYGGAVSVAATPRFTFGAELIGRQLLDVGGISQARNPHPLLPNVETLRLVAEEGSTSVVHLATGFKWNLAGRWTLNAGVLWTLTNAGLTARAVPSVAIERTFGD